MKRFLIASGENIESVFTRSKVEDSYGSVELGELAHETDMDLKFLPTSRTSKPSPMKPGQPEMIITRLKLTDFPFIRYKMKDIADVEFRPISRRNREIRHHEN